jgi:hypothetical protein
MELIKLAGSAWKIFKWITYVSYMNPPVWYSLWAIWNVRNLSRADFTNILSLSITEKTVSTKEKHTSCDCSEPLLPSCIPNLKLNPFAIKLNGSYLKVNTAW